MKKFVPVLLAVFLLADIASNLLRVPVVHAQVTVGQFSVGPLGAPGACAAATPQPGVFSICGESSSQPLWITEMVGSTLKYVAVPMAGTSGLVKTVFGRTPDVNGNIAAVNGDYQFSQLSGTLTPVQMPATENASFKISGASNPDGTIPVSLIGPH